MRKRVRGSSSKDMDRYMAKKIIVRKIIICLHYREFLFFVLTVRYKISVVCLMASENDARTLCVCDEEQTVRYVCMAGCYYYDCKGF